MAPGTASVFTLRKDITIHGYDQAVASVSLTLSLPAQAAACAMGVLTPEFVSVQGVPCFS